MSLIRARFLLPLLALPLMAHAGALGDYNVLMFGSYTGSSSDVEGKMLAGGSVYLTDYSVGLGLPLTGPTPNAIVSGGVISFIRGVAYGNVVAAGGISASQVGYGHGGSLKQYDSFPFRESLRQTAFAKPLSSSLGQKAANGTAALKFGTLTFTGTNANLNVFEVQASALLSAFGYTINVPAGSTALINVRGASATLANAGTSKFDPTRTLWNFSDATTLNISGLQFEGSILAPYASISANNGIIDGQLIGKEFNGNAQINSRNFVGAVPEPTTFAALGLGALGLLRRRKR